MKIVSIVGVRPQFIKYALISEEIRRRNHEDILIHTGQHYDYEMSKIFFDQLHLPEPKYNLNVGSMSHGMQTGTMLMKIEDVLLDEKPDMVLVYGDTNSTLAGALASVKQHIPTGHVEAGLRSYDRDMPEEINRVASDAISDILFAPTETATKNLAREGFSRNVHLVGDVMCDLLKKWTTTNYIPKITKDDYVLPKHYYLATIHRPSNTDNVHNLTEILSALSSIDTEVVFPVHPRTEHFIRRYNIERTIGNNVRMLKPVSYFDFLWLEENALKILTDSGGIQKEAYLFKVPCITLRDTTEWVETLESGWNVLVGADKEKIIEAIHNFNPKGKQADVFGKGDTNRKIVELVEKYG